MEILGNKIRKGVRNYLELEVASLYTRTRIAIPVIVQKSAKPGPTLLLVSGIHGDEVNGIEINRRLLFEKLVKPLAGTVITVPIANVMAFINLDRKFADGRDLNRSFPGSHKGSLAAQIGHLLSTEIIPKADAVIDLHTGAEDRSNAAQIRYGETQPESANLANTFNPPFTLLQPKPPRGSLRRLLDQQMIPSVIFEGGKSRSIDEEIVTHGMRGVLNVAASLGIIAKSDFKQRPVRTTRLAKSHWIRASSSGMLEPLAKNGSAVKSGELLAYINGPYAQFQKKIRARRDGFVICVNESPVVHRGDAVFHVGETQ